MNILVLFMNIVVFSMNFVVLLVCVRMGTSMGGVFRGVRSVKESVMSGRNEVSPAEEGAARPKVTGVILLVLAIPERVKQNVVHVEKTVHLSIPLLS